MSDSALKHWLDNHGPIDRLLVCPPPALYSGTTVYSFLFNLFSNMKNVLNVSFQTARREVDAHITSCTWSTSSPGEEPAMSCRSRTLMNWGATETTRALSKLQLEIASVKPQTGWSVEEKTWSDTVPYQTTTTTMLVSDCHNTRKGVLRCCARSSATSITSSADCLSFNALENLLMYSSSSATFLFAAICFSLYEQASLWPLELVDKETQYQSSDNVGLA